MDGRYLNPAERLRATTVLLDSTEKQNRQMTPLHSLAPTPLPTRPPKAFCPGAAPDWPRAPGEPTRSPPGAGCNPARSTESFHRFIPCSRSRRRLPNYGKWSKMFQVATESCNSIARKLLVATLVAIRAAQWYHQSTDS